MKLQGLAILFVILILPLSIIIGEYASFQIETFRLERLYDSRLITATHDAIKTYQINTFNDELSDIVNNKLDTIEASATTFYNSLRSGFAMQGYTAEELQQYVPALVYTMYDGYYIYSPYTDVAKIGVEDFGDADDTNNVDVLQFDKNGEGMVYGFKPYVYYSCRYYIDDDNDFVINYTLDNYITISGMVNDSYVNKSGYLVTLASSKGEEGLFREYDSDTGIYTFYYSGQEILPEDAFEDHLVVQEENAEGEMVSTTKAYKYIKINGEKYYYEPDGNIDGDDEPDRYFFHLVGGQRVIQVGENTEDFYKYMSQMKLNRSAISYYANAYEFTTWVNTYLAELDVSKNQEGINDTGNGKIFRNEQIEYSSSNFNLHRKEVIRYSIESNLSIAIANYNKYSNAGVNVNFQMPKLKETEWEMLENEISVISFLQGLNIGGKIYNGYTVVTNNKNEEFVDEESIYITTNDGYYNKINDTNFEDEAFADKAQQGILDLDFETRRDGKTKEYYIPKKGLASYSSVVGQEKLNSKYDTIYEYLQQNNIRGNVINIYYTALARERWASFKLENPSQVPHILNEMAGVYDYLPITEAEKNTNGKGIVTNGLIRDYDALNTDGKKNTSLGGTSELMAEWKDLSGHYDAISEGAIVNSEYVGLDGIDDWINLGQVRDKNKITLEAKIKINEIQSAEHIVISNFQEGGFGIFLWDGKPVFQVYIQGKGYIQAESTQELQTNRVYNISGTYDGTTLRLYIDGELKVEKVEEGNIKNPEENTVMSIGNNPKGNNQNDGGFANIKVYSARIYDRALSYEEINQNIIATKAGSISGGSEPETPEDIAPTIVIGEPGISPNTYISLSSKPTLSTKVTVTNNGTPITSIKYAFTTSPNEPSAWSNEITTDGSTTSTTVWGTATESGIWYLHVKAQSGSKTVSEYFAFDEIIEDNEGPEIIITNVDGVSGGSYPATATVIKKTVTAIDSQVEVESLQAIYTMDSTPPLEESSGWQDAKNNGIMQLTEIGAGKTYYLHVIAKDENGNKTTARYKYTVKSVVTCDITINHTDGKTSHYTTNGATQSISMQKEIIVNSSTGIGLIQYALSASISDINNISDGLWTNVSGAGTTENTISLLRSIIVTNRVYLHVKVLDVDGNVIKTHTKVWTVGKNTSDAY